MVACKDWHDIPAGPIKFIRVLYHEEGEIPNVSVAHMVFMCFHCQRPLCVDACPSGAIYKRQQDGIVMIERDKCPGRLDCNSACIKACPHGAPQFGAEPNARMQKCDFCVQRWQQGSKPVCVEACPTRALQAGPIDELEAVYNGGFKATGFHLSTKGSPSIRINAK
jgi:anaerobic dimethyl sulfoxide reductase subunit B (iron-sulfur subunit)